jgi:protease-4
VAAGRNLPIERVADSIGQGRVWTGNQAIELGLVDAIGSLKDAIACAAGLAGLENHGISYYPSPSNPFETFLISLSEDAKLKLAGMNLQELYLAFQQMKYLNKSHGVRAELPYGFKLIY